MVWLDQAGHPQQAAVARYVDDDKVRESTWTPGPFDNIHDVADVAMHSLDVQLKFW